LLGEIVVLTGGDQNHTFTITLWEKQTDLEVSEANGYLQLQLAKGVPFLAAASTRKVYEVGVLW
jgi:hypothetical protein